MMYIVFCRTMSTRFIINTVNIIHVNKINFVQAQQSVLKIKQLTTGRSPDQLLYVTTFESC